MLIDIPSHLKTSPVITIERGMAVSVMNVVRKFSRKRNSTMTTSTAPSRRASMTLRMLKSMNVFCW